MNGRRFTVSRDLSLRLLAAVIAVLGLASVLVFDQALNFVNFESSLTDLGKFKTPTLRALAARAPYFHNGIAPTLSDVVRHYEKQLLFVYTDQERADLVAFLNAL